ncbi:hypothetical protein SUGI_1170630 [Cryptomeria japonica]|nr:hypothetical protein SUGI_1170630 [Cryptomeria japonica]
MMWVKMVQLLKFLQLHHGSNMLRVKMDNQLEKQFFSVDPSQQAIHYPWPRLLQPSASSSAAQTQERDEVIPEEKTIVSRKECESIKKMLPICQSDVLLCESG